MNKELLKPLKWYKSLALLKGRSDAGAFLLEGDRAIRQVFISQPDAIIEILILEGLSHHYANYPVRYLTKSQLRDISATTTPQGIIAVVRLPEATYSDQAPPQPGNKMLLLADIQDPGNVGTLIRTAAAFGFSGAILSDKCADPFSPKCVQSTAGSILSLWLRRTHNYIELVELLKQRNYILIAADLNGTSDVAIFSKMDKFILALGNEAAGLSANILNKSDYRVKIPIDRNQAESLNVAVSGAVLMFLSSTKS